MAFISSGMCLIKPGCRTFPCRPEKPQGPFGGIKTLALNGLSGQPDILLAGRLIKIRHLHGFKTAWGLENHLLQDCGSPQNRDSWQSPG